MRNILTILFILFSANISAQTPTANAGNDITIYLTAGNSVSLVGTAANRNTSLWREVSTDYSSGATITNASSLNATVSGLPQGVFYFELAVTSATSVVKRDTVMVTVDHDPPPANSTLIRYFDMAGVTPVVNNRADTTNYYPVTDGSYGQITLSSGKWYFFRDRSNGLTVDNQYGKLTSMIEDGYQGDAGYARAEVGLADNNFKIDTNKIYCFEWKGYFPQNTNYLVGAGNILTMFQIHGVVEVPNPFGLNMFSDKSIKITDYFNGSYTMIPITTLDEFYNSAHTIRVTMRESKGYAGQDGFLKVEIDGVQKYYRKTNSVGSASFDDYVKFGGLYDFNHSIVNVDSLSRGRKYKLVTESFKAYELSDTVTVAAPTLSISGDQIITVDHTGVSASATWASGHGGSYLWTKTSGASVTITNSTSSSATISGLVTGEYDIQCKATQDDGQFVTHTVHISVTLPAVGGITNYFISSGPHKIYRDYQKP